MKYRLSLFPILLLALAACNTNPKPKTAGEANSLPVALQQSFYKKMKGTIGDIPVTMDLTRDDTALTGSYYYDRVGLPLSIGGKINPDGQFSFSESNEKGEQTGLFTGSFSSDTTIEGNWVNVQTKKSLPFKLAAVTEGIVTVAYESRHRENCSHAKEHRRHISENTAFHDTLCTILNLDLLKITAPTAEATQKINNTITRVFCEAAIGEPAPTTIEELLHTVDHVEEGEGYELSIVAGLVTNDNNILCIDFSGYSYGYGAAHPLSASGYHNFDIRTGEKITLDQLLVPAYQTRLNRIAEKLFIKTNDNEGWNFEEGQFELNDNFAITPGGLLFLFNQYEIGPYVMGVPTVFIPYKDMQDLVNPESMIGVWSKK